MKKLIVRFWLLFKATPLGRLIRWLSPQWLVNLLEHLPIAILANIIYGFPSRKIKVIGVTGTDGKTTTVNMIYKVLKDSGLRVSMVSTINTSIGGKDYDTGFHVTSPHSFIIQEFIRKALKAGDEYIVLEVTSHALDQHRFLGVRFEIGVITNITHEHLDYHKTFENYRAAKSLLIKQVKWAVLNRDDPNFDYLSKASSGKVVSFGMDPKSDINPKNYPLGLSIPGEYNLMNALASSGVAQALGISRDKIIKSLNSFKSLRGRMEEVKNNKGIKIFIDFAHTPNGLKSALESLKSQRVIKSQRLISIIGCEGYRDEKKREMMGEISVKLADYTIITPVDPRGLLDQINSQILEGVKKAGGVLDKDVFVIDDRKQAIDFALNKLAKRGDIVGIFGKGHETSINLDGKKEIPWSDIGAVKEALNGREN